MITARDMSSLSQQLKSINEKTASVALDRKSRSKIHSKSLIFDPKIASTQDYDYLYQIGLEGLEDLIEIDSRFSKFKQTLFSETTINLDRNVQTQDTLDQLNKNVEVFLSLVSPYYLLTPSTKAVEWLIRRFYINIHNGEMLLLTSLPFYNSPVFVKILNVIPKNQFPKIFEWVVGYKDLLKSPTSSSILKSFHNDAKFFELYSKYLMDQLNNHAVFKEQLVFYLANTVQLVASFTHNLGQFGETYLPVILEVVGKLLLAGSKFSSTLRNDIMLTAYSIISVLSSLVPLSADLVKSFTESILQDPTACDSNTRKQTVIVLGQLWNFYNEDNFEVDCFKNLPASKLVQDDLLKNLIEEGYKINKLLVVYFASNLPQIDAFKIFDFINVDKSETFFKIVTSKLLYYAYNNQDEAIRAKLIEAFESLLRTNKELFVKVLQNYKDGLDISQLEMQLMTTLGDSNIENIHDADIELEDEEEEEEEDQAVLDVDFSDVCNSLENYKTSTTSFLNKSSDEEFTKLFQAFAEKSRSFNIKSQKLILAKFSKAIFVSPEASISFMLRVSFTPSVPLSIRLLVLRFIKLRLKELSLSEDKIDTYLLAPILLLGLYDTNKSVRAGFAELLRVVKDTTLKFHGNKKKVKTSLFMEDQIYGNTEPSKRAIVPPQDGLEMLNVLIEDSKSILDDTVIDKSRLNYVLFQVLFKSQKSGQKKFGQLLLKTFILNQWALPFWPIVFKYKVWNIISIENNSNGGNDDRFFFIDTDLTDYFSNRDDLIEQAKASKIDFENDVEKAIVGLVGGTSSNDKNVNKEADWLLKALEAPNKLQVAAGKRLSSVFTSFTSIDMRAKLVNKLIELLINDGDDSDNLVVDPVEVLQLLDMDHETIISVLRNVQIVSQIPEQGIVKRRRRSSNSTKQAMARDDISSIAATHLKKLTIVLDLLEFNLRKKTSDIAKPDLLQNLFRILTDLDYLGNDGNLPILYAQETLASCMLLSIVQMKDNSKSNSFKFDSNVVRADLIVNSIRLSQSPQVQNRLLLVIAELAALAPEIILHSVMPIFTFMGAHTVRQDDEFSSSALQQTIAKVIPALAANGSSSLSYEIEFLLTSFVAAFQHIPRHRRVKLFTSLTKTLSYKHSLHIILFLMGQQYSNNITRNKAHESISILEFTSAFLKNFSAQEQLEGVEKFYQLWNQIPNAQLEPNSDEFNALSSRSIFGVSILSLSKSGLLTFKSQLLNFIDKVLDSDTQNDFSNLPSLKLKIALILLDPKKPAEDKSDLLNYFRKVTSFILSSLDTFTNVSRNDVLLDNLYALLGNFLDLLPLNYFIDSIIDSLDCDQISNTLEIKIAKNFAILASRKIENELNANNIDDVIEESILQKLLPVLNKGIKKNLDIELQQAYLNAFSSIVNKFGGSTHLLVTQGNTEALINSLNIITSNSGLLSEQPEIVISSINAITSIVNVLGVKAIGLFPKIVPPSLNIWKTTTASEDESSKLLQASIILLLACLIKKIPVFMTTSLDSIFITILTSDSVDNTVRSSVLQLIVEHMELSQVLKSLCNIWNNKKFYQNDNAGNLGLYLNVLQSTIERMDKKSASSQSTLFMKWLIQAFEFRHYAFDENNKFDNNTIHKLESSFHSCGASYVMKLNDKSFRPLFANLVRWAVSGEGSNATGNTELSRLLAFFKFFSKLQDKLKSIITSYFSYLIDPVSSILNRFANGDIVDINLRRILLNSLTSSFKYDQDDYWSQQLRFDSICSPLLNQLSNIEPNIGKYLVKCVSSFISNVSSEEYNEKLVHGLIEFISNENESTTSNTKIWTIRTLKTIFQKMGEQWLSYLPTLIPYIAELLEDDDEEVELEVRNGLVRVIENVLGEPLDRYLD